MAVVVCSRGGTSLSFLELLHLQRAIHLALATVEKRQNHRKAVQVVEALRFRDSTNLSSEQNDCDDYPCDTVLVVWRWVHPFCSVGRLLKLRFRRELCDIGVDGMKSFAAI